MQHLLVYALFSHFLQCTNSPITTFEIPIDKNGSFNTTMVLGDCSRTTNKKHQQSTKVVCKKIILFHAVVMLVFHVMYENNLAFSSKHHVLAESMLSPWTQINAWEHTFSVQPPSTILVISKSWQLGKNWIKDSSWQFQHFRWFCANKWKQVMFLLEIQRCKCVIGAGS